MRSRKLSLWVSSLRWPLAAGCCLTVDDDEGPSCRSETLLGRAARQHRLRRQTCDEAGGGQWMEWTLYKVETDADGDVIDVDVASDEEPCADAIDVIEPAPGEYWLDIAGLDADDNEISAASCPMDEDQT